MAGTLAEVHTGDKDISGETAQPMYMYMYIISYHKSVHSFGCKSQQQYMYIYPYRQECNYFHNCTLSVIAYFFSSTKAIAIGIGMIRR